MNTLTLVITKKQVLLFFEEGNRQITARYYFKVRHSQNISRLKNILIEANWETTNVVFGTNTRRSNGLRKCLGLDMIKTIINQIGLSQSVLSNIPEISKCKNIQIYDYQHMYIKTPNSDIFSDNRNIYYSEISGAIANILNANLKTNYCAIKNTYFQKELEATFSKVGEAKKSDEEIDLSMLDKPFIYIEECDYIADQLSQTHICIIIGEEYLESYRTYEPCRLFKNKYNIKKKENTTLRKNVGIEKELGALNKVFEINLIELMLSRNNANGKDNYFIDVYETPRNGVDGINLIHNLMTKWGVTTLVVGNMIYLK